MKVQLIILAICSGSIAWSHEGRPIEWHDLWQSWTLDPGTVIGLLLFAFLYGRGARRNRGVFRRQMLCFWSGWIILAAALVSPIHSLGEVLFSVHMVQHEILMVVAAPLLVASRPLVPMLWGLPLESRRLVGRLSKPNTAWRLLTHPMTAWWIHAAALWLWHIPILFQATIRNDWIHAAQHLSFLGSALLFWYSLFYAHGRSSYGASALYIFSTGVHTSILGALLMFSSTPWYTVYEITTHAWGLTPLEDQQLGGVIMWIPAGLVYLIVGLTVVAMWLGESERSANKRAARGLAVMRANMLILSLCLCICQCRPVASRRAEIQGRARLSWQSMAVARVIRSPGLSAHMAKSGPAWRGFGNALISRVNFSISQEIGALD